MKNKNYTQLDRCILETANEQLFIDKSVLVDKVMKKQKNGCITENEVEDCLKKLTEQNAISLHTCYRLEDRQITNELLFKAAKILIPVAISAAILIQIYLMSIY